MGAPAIGTDRDGMRRAPYPEIDPYETGMLDVGDGQHLYWECSGNPDGAPVLFVHGGPGGGTDPAHRRMFCLLYTSPSPRDLSTSRMPSSA